MGIYIISPEIRVYYKSRYHEYIISSIGTFPIFLIWFFTDLIRLIRL